MITKAQLNNALVNYISLPTRKRDVMTYTVQMAAKQAVREFLIKYDQEEFPSGTELLVMIRDWIAQSGWSKTKKHKMARIFMAILKDQYIVDETASRDLVKRFKYKTDLNWSEKALTASELGILFYKMYDMKSKYTDLRCATSIAFMLFSGARIQAALTAKNYVVTEEFLSVTIERQKSRVIEDIPKSIPLDIVMPNGIEFRHLIDEYMKEKERRSYPSSYLFAGKDGAPLTAGAVRGYITRLNLPFHLTPHKLRHTAGTMVAENAGVLEATRLLDHSAISITQSYIKKYTGDSSESIKKAWSGYDIPVTHREHMPARNTQKVIDSITSYE